MNDTVVKLTKKFLIDMFDLTFFSDQVSWDGIDQYHSLPIIDFYDNQLAGKTESRGVYFFGSKTRTAMKMLITLSEENCKSSVYKVCYRLKSITKETEIDGLVYYPFSNIEVDIAACNLNLGLKQDSALSFFDKNKMSDRRDWIFNLLTFLCNSKLSVNFEEGDFNEFFGDSSVYNYPPSAGDPHFNPVFIKQDSPGEGYMKGLKC